MVGDVVNDNRLFRSVRGIGKMLWKCYHSNLNGFNIEYKIENAHFFSSDDNSLK